MSSLKEELIDGVLDILREVANIGAGNAMTALSQILNTKIDMNVVQVDVTGIDDVQEMFEKYDKFVVANLIEIVEGMRAVLLLILSEDSTKEMVLAVLGRRPENVMELDEIERSFVSEIGNILGGTYLNAIGTFLDKELHLAPPQIAVDMPGAILTMPAIEFCDENQDTIIIRTEFKDDNGLLNGTYVLMLDQDTERDIINIIGKYYGN